MSLLQRIPTHQFNRLCLVVVTLWLLISVPLGIHLRPTIPDFEQFYMGGVMVVEKHWDALYPIPKARSLDNPGLSIHSKAKPKWRELSKERGVWDHTHFMLPPPTALVFAPLAFVSYSKAFWLFTFFLSACVWGVALCASRILRAVFGHKTRWEGGVMLLIVFSPMAARAIRIANVSPPVALTIGLTLLTLLYEKSSAFKGGASLLIGALFKYATLVLLPLLVVMRRWGMVAFLLLLGLAVLCATVAASGTEPFREFYEIILPTLSRPSAFRGNQTIPGLLARTMGRPFSSTLTIALNSARIFTLGAILILIFSIQKAHWRKPVVVVAAASMLLSWLLIFSPIAWEHWPLFLCPAWGWLIWETRRPGHQRHVAIIALVLMALPAGIFQIKGFAQFPMTLPEPLNSTQLIGHILVLGLAFARLTPLVSHETAQNEVR